MHMCLEPWVCFFFLLHSIFYTNNIFYNNEQVLANTKQRPPPPPPPSLECEMEGFYSSNTSTSTPLSLEMQDRGVSPFPILPPPPPLLKMRDGGGFSTPDTSNTPSLAQNKRRRDFQHLHYPLPRSKRETEGISPLLVPPPPPPSLETRDGGGFSISNTSTTPSLAQNARRRGFLHFQHLHHPLPHSKREMEGFYNFFSSHTTIPSICFF